jgi:voltage-gated potassium channel
VRRRRGSAPEEARLPAARLPGGELSPAAAIGRRVLFAVLLITFIAGVTWLDRGGYRDANGDGVGLLDAFYYSTVTVTTTGYGDVVPETDGARLLTTLVVTPARILFLILLVGTTLELLAERTRQGWTVRRWRARMRDHIIVCGYGTKGRSAIKVLQAQGTEDDGIVVIDTDPAATERATGVGFASITGSASSTDVLRSAGIDRARVIVVAPDRDDSAVLITLTARELNPRIVIVAAAREAENVHLLRQSGADSVITSADAAGRLLGLATRSPRVVELLEDLLSVGEGIDIVERAVTEEEVGGPPRQDGQLVVGVVRDERMLRFDDPAASRLNAGDRVVCLRPGDAGSGARRAAADGSAP